MDIVATCPKRFWEKWLKEGDCAGDTISPSIHVEYYWFTKSRAVLKLHSGDRLYIVCNGKLRGWAPIVRIISDSSNTEFGIVRRRGGAVACTISEEIPGFRGLRKRWWDRDDEVPFPNWKDA
jgi:hypothetical protein